MIVFAGDPHGNFTPIIRECLGMAAGTLVLVGDCDCRAPLPEILAPLVEAGWSVRWILGNHDTETERAWDNLVTAHPDGDIGLRVNNQTATMVVNGMNVAMREELFRLTKYPVLLIIEDRTGAFWLMGETGGAYVDKLGASVGQNGTDRRGQEVSFKAEELQMAAQVNANVMANIYLGDTNCILQDSDGSYLQDADTSYLSDFCTGTVVGDFYVVDFDTNDFVV